MKGYRTIAVNGAVIVLPILDFLANDGILVSQLMGTHAPAVLSCIGLLNLILRLITTTPVTKSE